LEEIDPKIPAEEMIYRLCFRREGLLFSEFDRIFSDLFSRRAPSYKKIVMRLADGDADLSQICQALQVEKGGLMSEYLTDLEETQYIQRYNGWNLKDGKRLKTSRYRLKDNYLRFYLKYIEPHADAIVRGRLKKVPAWDAILGLQFENLVVNHCKQLYSLLKIPLDQIIRDGPYRQRQTKLHRGCQIDYLLQLQYNSLYLCEIKYSSKPIGIEIVEEVQEKMHRLSHPKVCFSIRPVLIHVNGVSDALLENSFFTHIIDFSQFLVR
jgi:hypothetical protein